MMCCRLCKWAAVMCNNKLQPIMYSFTNCSQSYWIINSYSDNCEKLKSIWAIPGLWSLVTRRFECAWCPAILRTNCIEISGTVSARKCSMQTSPSLLIYHLLQIHIMSEKTIWRIDQHLRLESSQIRRYLSQWLWTWIQSVTYSI